MVASALIAAGGSILGGLFGKSDPKDVVPNYAKRRRKAEEAGFNPLTALGVQASVGQSANYMGSAIADAALLLADGLEKDKEKSENEALKAKNKALQEKVTSLTLRPKVPGVYGQRIAGGQSEAAPLNPALVSPLAAEPVHSGDSNLTPVQSAVAQDVPAFRFLGHDFYGSGLFSTAQQMEDGAGEIASALWGGVTVADAFMNEAYKAGRSYRARREYAAHVERSEAELRKANSKDRKVVRHRTTDWEKRHKSRWFFD